MAPKKGKKGGKGKKGKKRLVEFIWFYPSPYCLSLSRLLLLS